MTQYAIRNTQYVARLFQQITQKPGFKALFLFLVALLPRLPGLDRFLTSDENTNIFFAGSDVIAAFLQGDLRGTYWHFYPGVTMSWLDALGMTGQYLFDVLTGRSTLPFSDYIYSDILSLVVANRLPYAFLTAGAVAALYWLARKLLPERVAWLGSLFLAFDPFYLAHSRVAHGDAPVAVFMSLSALTFFIYMRRIVGDPKLNFETPPSIRQLMIGAFADPYLIASAIFGSLAALTKAPGQFMALFIVGLSILCAFFDFSSLRPKFLILTRWVIVIAVWGLVSLAVFILLWPSMWVDPVGTFRQMWDETFSKVNEGHLVFFFGRPTLDPGPWFYAYVIPFRLTPIILIGSLLSLLCFMPKLCVFFSEVGPSYWRDSKDENLVGRALACPTRNEQTKVCSTNLTSDLSESGLTRYILHPVFLLWLFIITLLLFGNLSPKKQDRYLLPLFPLLNLIAAIGWLGFLDLTCHFLIARCVRNKSLITNYQLLITTLLTLILLLLHFLPTLTYYPYYLTYFNPLMGGPTRAAETTLMGWGEGMEQVAAYLNSKPQAAELYVASTPSQTLLPYFAGTGENFYTNDIALRADYVVLYLAQMQRLAPSPEIVHYFEAQTPEQIITIQGVSYAKIYPGPKLILPDIPPEATPVNIGLEDRIRLAGYKITDYQPHPRQASAGQTLPITLYWHALTPLTADYTISVRIRTVDGQLLTQQDSWPVEELLPTTQWRQGDYVTDTHTLEISTEDWANVAEFEIVIYNAETGQTLGPPISLPINDKQINNEQ